VQHCIFDECVKKAVHLLQHTYLQICDICAAADEQLFDKCVFETKKCQIHAPVATNRGVDPYGTGRGDMSPPNILEVMLFWLGLFYPVTDNCCLLYFNANIMCNFTKKASASGGLHSPDLLPGLYPWTPMGDCRPQTPSLFYAPPIIL